MNPSITHYPTYIGFYLSLLFAVTCNVFLDIQYGGFTTEVIAWGMIFAFTLRIGWKQGGEISASGKRWQRLTLIVGLVLFIVMFLPMWGLPRAGIYLLAMLQAAQNCVTVSRRHLHLGLLVSVVMVMFAASHFRADWTMLFYLLPYIVAVVFTLVTEQIQRKTELLTQQSLNKQVGGAQWTAITAATTAILMLGLLLYVVTPQITRAQVSWIWGQPTNMGIGGEDVEVGSGDDAGEGNQQGSLQGQGRGPGQEQPGQGQGQQDAQSSEGGFGQGLPSPAEMRESANRKGMPEWQQSAINQIADTTEWAQVSLQPVADTTKGLMKTMKQMLQQVMDNFISLLYWLLLLVLLIIMWLFIIKTRVGLAMLIISDRFKLGFLNTHASGRAGAAQYYRAIERLFDYEKVKRSKTTNTHEYLTQMCTARRDLQEETTQITRLFENARYGSRPVNRLHLRKMRGLYLQVYEWV